MMPEVSAGSNHVGASATCEAQVMWPEGALADCADACVAATRATAAARAIVRARERVMVCPPLRCDKSETWLAGCEVDRLSPNPSGCQWGRERRTRAIAGVRRSVLASPAHGRHPRLGRALLARRHRPAGALASDREAGGDRPRRALFAHMGERDRHSHDGRPRPRRHRGLRLPRAHLRRRARGGSPARARRRLHPRPRRSRLRPAPLPRGGARAGLARAHHRRPPQHRRALRPLPSHRAVERPHQLAAVLHRRHVATTYDYPDVIYDATHRLEAGDLELELTHARGETDDHTWIWWPARRILFTGDLFLWVAPNAGNPQKVQRHAAEWARALRAMAERPAELLVPGHGMPVFGAARVRQALEDTAEWLETLEHETVARMNAGLTLDRILAEVRPPAHLAERPYLHAVYDEPEYVVRNVWRLYGGWWDGIPSHLKPASEAALGAEVAMLAGGVGRLVERAQALLVAGDLALASHVADWAAAAEPASREVHLVRARVYEARAREAAALMTRGIFSAAAADSARRSEA